jgi:hypothetical protein
VAFGVLTVEVALLVWRMNVFTPDSETYFELARGFAAGHWGRLVNGAWVPEGIRPPIYPLFVALLHEGIGLSPRVVSAIQVALALWSCWLLSKLAPNAVWFFVLVGGYPIAFAYSATLMTEGLTVVEAALVIYATTRPWGRSMRGAFAIGLICGVSVITRPNLLLLPGVPVLVLWLERRELAAPMRLLALFLVGFLLALAPMSAFNFAHHKKLTPLAYPGSSGTSLYLASWEGLAELEDLNGLYTFTATPNATRIGLDREVTALNLSIGAPALTAPWSLERYSPELWIVASERIKTAAAEHVKREPGAYARRTLWASWRLWCGTLAADRFGPFVSMALTALSTVLWALGLLGASLALRRGASREHRAVGFLVGMVAMTQPLLHVEGRFTAHARLPLALCACFALQWLLALPWKRSGSGLSATKAEERSDDARQVRLDGAAGPE